jgi:hypothetical protein
MTVTVARPFNVSVKDLGNGNELCIIDIDDIGTNLKACMDAKFVKICEGISGTDLKLVKKRLITFLSTKKGSTTEGGAIAEFLLHLYLNDGGFQPQFLYFNLEEGSIKKGFDGYYFYNGDEWILESKSGSSNTKDISHASKIKEAYDDLQGKFTGTGTNNPWRNAYSHASHLDVGANANVRANIKKFSDEYDQKTFYKTDKFNIIPGSTIFLDGIWVASDISTIDTEIKSLIKKFSFNKIIVICITKKSIQIFWDYLNSA